MDTNANMPAVQPSERPRATYWRIVVLEGATSVSLNSADYDNAMRLVGNNYSRVSATVRQAALEVALQDKSKMLKSDRAAEASTSCKCPQSFSARVRAKAFAKLRGAYRPATSMHVDAPPEPVARFMSAQRQIEEDLASATLAAENNKAWEH